MSAIDAGSPSAPASLAPAILIPSDKNAQTKPSPCELALANPDVHKFISHHVAKGERGLCAVVMALSKDASSLSIAHIAFLPLERLQKKPPQWVASFLRSIPSIIDHVKADDYDPTSQVLLAAALLFAANGKNGCQFGRFSAREQGSPSPET